MQDVMRFNKRRRPYRLVIAFLAPPVLGSFLFIGTVLLLELREGIYGLQHVIDSFSYLHLLVLFSLIYIGIQSLAYSLLMEFVIRPGLTDLKMFLLASVPLASLRRPP